MFYTQGRTFGAPTTGRRKLAVHNENDLTTFNPSGLPSKTPSRAGSNKAQIQLGPSTVGRVGLGAKTEGRDRNVLKGQQGGEGEKGKGKGKEEEIEPKRLFASSSTLPPSKSLSNLPLIPSSRSAPNPSKTPGRPPPSIRNNLRTPAPGTFRIAQDISSTPLPSATRRRKSRNSGSGSLSGSGSNTGLGQTPLRPTQKDEFKTPAPSAKWEEGDSLGSIDEVGPGIGVELDVLGEEEEESEEEEIEYMPPRAIELPYEPDWDIEVDILKETKRAQGLPAVMFGFGGLGDIKEIEMKFDIGTDILKGASEEWLKDPLFAQKPKSTEPLFPKNLTKPISSTLATRPKAATIASKPTTKSRPPIPPIPIRKVIPKSTNPPSGKTGISVLKPRPANPNIPNTTKVLPKTAIKGKEEDEGILKAQEELATQEMTFDFGF